MERSRREAEWRRAWPFASASSPKGPEPQRDEALSPLDAPSPERRRQEQPFESELEGVYIISVAARLLSMHPQTLRKYERVGLIVPSRTLGMLRLYSEEDIARLRLIKHLVEDLGLNLAGVDLAMELVRRLVRLRQEVAQLHEGAQVGALVTGQIDEILRLLGLSLPESRRP